MVTRCKYCSALLKMGSEICPNCSKKHIVQEIVSKEVTEKAIVENDIILKQEEKVADPEEKSAEEDVTEKSKKPRSKIFLLIPLIMTGLPFFLGVHIYSICASFIGIVIVGTGFIKPNNNEKTRELFEILYFVGFLSCILLCFIIVKWLLLLLYLAFIIFLTSSISGQRYTRKISGIVIVVGSLIIFLTIVLVIIFTNNMSRIG